MTSGPTLPPQAYTREILTAAFNWLQSQPESVRKLATTPDALVGLYMRAQRYGNSTLETDAPVSSQNFMSNLKTLAEGLKQFDQPGSAQASSSHNVHSHMTPTVAAQLTSQMQTQIPHQTPLGLNEVSLRMIQDVRNHLNLSTDSEAVNMMLALAYKNLKGLLG